MPGKQLAAKKNRKRGFTLIELIVVIVIIVIIAVIATPSLTRYINSAEKRALQVTAHNIQLVLQDERFEQFAYPFSGIASAPVASGADAYTDAVSGTTYTYDDILALNAIILKPNETFDGIFWDGAILGGFTFKNTKHTVTYTTAGGFVITP